MSQSYAKSQKFYRDNYEVIFQRKLTDAREPPQGQKTLRQCKFCNRVYPLTAFGTIAHTVPSMIGNRTLFSLDECSSCNKNFGLLEDDFGKFTMPERAFAFVGGHNKVPSLRMGDGNRVKVSSPLGRIEFEVRPGTKSVMASENGQSVAVKVRMQPYRPLAVYKTFVKMAVAVAPMTEMSLFELSREWLALEGLVPDFLPKTLIPAFAIHYGLEERLKHPEILLLKKRPSSILPSISLIVRFGISQYQIFPPCILSSELPRKKSLILEHFIPPRTKITGAGRNVFSNYEFFDLSSPIKTNRIWRGSIRMAPGEHIEDEWV